MAKGWSFNGLIKSLRSGAFTNTGESKGELVVVGAKGLHDVLETTVSIDFNNYRFTAGEFLRVDVAKSKNVPFLLYYPDGTVVVEVISAWTETECALRVINNQLYSSGQMIQNKPFVYAFRNYRAWRVEAGMVTKGLDTDTHLNTLNTQAHIGFYNNAMSMGTFPDLGYPAEIAGSLEVIAAGIGVIQRYTTYSPRKSYSRVYHTSWSAWQETAAERPAGGRASDSAVLMSDFMQAGNGNYRQFPDNTTIQMVNHVVSGSAPQIVTLPFPMPNGIRFIGPSYMAGVGQPSCWTTQVIDRQSFKYNVWNVITGNQITSGHTTNFLVVGV